MASLDGCKLFTVLKNTMSSDFASGFFLFELGRKWSPVGHRSPEYYPVQVGYEGENFLFCSFTDWNKLQSSKGLQAPGGYLSE
jgi:hypothetical protein